MSSDPFIIRRFYKNENNSLTTGTSLSIALYPNAFLYLVRSGNDAAIEELCDVQITNVGSSAYSYPQLIARLIHDHFLHDRKFEQVCVMVLNKNFSILPEAYVHADKMPEVLDLNGLGRFSKIQSHRIQSMVFACGIDQELLEAIEKIFPQASVRHAGAVTCSLLLAGKSSRGGVSMLMNSSDEGLEFCACEKGSLLFYNYFPVATSEDALYYLLFSMEQFHIDPLTCSLLLAGNNSVSEDLVRSVKKYIRHVDFAGHDQVLPDNLKEIIPHHYYTLFNQASCEL